MARRSVLWALGIFGVLACACREKAESGAGAAPSASAVAELTTDWAKPRDSLLSVGDTAPDFDALAHTGYRVRLSQFLEKPVVVYFYPKDATPGCTTEAQQIRDAWLRIMEKASMVFGVSGDTNVSHREFATEHGLPFLLLSDMEFRIARSFGVPVKDGRASRVTFVVGKDGKVKRVFDQVNPDGHAEEILTALSEL